MAYSCVDIGDNLNSREVTIKSKFDAYVKRCHGCVACFRSANKCYLQFQFISEPAIKKYLAQHASKIHEQNLKNYLGHLEDASAQRHKTEKEKRYYDINEEMLNFVDDVLYQHMMFNAVPHRTRGILKSVTIDFKLTSGHNDESVNQRIHGHIQQNSINGRKNLQSIVSEVKNGMTRSTRPVDCDRLMMDKKIFLVVFEHF